MVLNLLPLVVLMSGQSPPPPPQEVKPAIVLPAKPAQAPRKVYPDAPDDNPKARIETAVKAAAEDDIRVLVVWGANDDERSSKFPAVQRAKEMTATRWFSDEYKLVYVDVGHLDKNLDVASVYGARPVAGSLPYFTVLDPKGKALANVASTELTGTDPAAVDPGKMATLLARHQAPAPDADPPFRAALSQAKKDGKYVFLWFTAPW